MATINFNPRPSPVLPEHRPLYKIAQAICIIGYTGRGGKASTLKINLINWALSSKSRQEALISSCIKKTLPFAAWGFDPALAIALLLCHAENLTNPTSNGHALTEKGRKFFESISRDTEIFIPDKEFLKLIGKRLTEDLVERESKTWGDYEDTSF